MRVVAFVTVRSVIRGILGRLIRRPGGGRCVPIWHRASRGHRRRPGCRSSPGQDPRSASGAGSWLPPGLRRPSRVPFPRCWCHAAFPTRGRRDGLEKPAATKYLRVRSDTDLPVQLTDTVSRPFAGSKRVEGRNGNCDPSWRSGISVSASLVRFARTGPPVPVPSVVWGGSLGRAPHTPRQPVYSEAVPG